MQLSQQAILGTGAFDGVGRPAGAYWNAGYTLLAVAGAFGGRQWHGRDVGKGRTLAWRVSVYEAATLRRIAVLDRVREPINHIAFHPHRPLLAIAAGRYDGGYLYKGELVLWDLATGASASLLDESREVEVCHFDEASDALHITLRPPVDEDYYDAERRLTLRPWRGPGPPPEPRPHMRLDTAIPAAAWRPMREQSVNLDQLPIVYAQRPRVGGWYTPQAREAAAAELAAIARDAWQRYTPRWDVWDLAWTPDDRLLAVRNATALECWKPTGELVQRLPDPMDGVQVLLDPGGDVAYANLFGGRVPRAIPNTDRVADTRVERIDLRSWERTIVPGLDAPATLSIAATGYLLARDTDHEWHRQGGPTLDRVVAPDLAVSAPLDLGGYDLFNHYLRIDGAPDLYFLQGTPPRTDWAQRPRLHAAQDKWICRLVPTTHRIERLFPLEWDVERNGHLMGVSGAYVRDDHGEALILAALLHHREVSRPADEVVVRRRLPDGQALWAAAFDSQVTALVHLPDLRAVVVALTDGHLAALDAGTGALLDYQPLIVAGVDSVALSLAGHGRRVAAGLVDGRLLLLECRL